MNPVRYAILTLFVVLAVGTTGSCQNSADAEALMQRFLAHMAANTPVAGEFEVRGKFDPAARERQLKQFEKINKEKMKDGAQMQPEKDDQLLVCRWAYDRDREMLETLPGSKNDFKTFYLDREALLDGFEAGAYILNKPGRVATWHPGKFYFISGTEERWATMLAAYSPYEITAAPPGSPAGTVLLRARRPEHKMEVRLLIDREACILHGVESYYDSKLIMRLTIEEFVRGPDHRLFPKRAEITVYGPPDFDLLRTESLTAKNVVFPRSQADTDRSFALTLPKGARIADRVLNKMIVLDRPTPVQTIITGQLPSKPFDREAPTPTTVDLADAQWKRWYWIAGFVCAVFAGGFVVWAVLRRRRA